MFTRITFKETVHKYAHESTIDGTLHPNVFIWTITLVMVSFMSATKFDKIWSEISITLTQYVSEANLLENV